MTRSASKTEALSVLRERFGHDDFQPGQWEPIRAVLERRDALVVMPTGSGKSLVYQLPALAPPARPIIWSIKVPGPAVQGFDGSVASSS